MDCSKTFYLPSLAIVAQVAKSIIIGQETYQLGRSQMIMQPVKVSDLAKLTHMSVPSFRDHFKAVTSMTPMQYQKTILTETTAFA